MPRGLSRPAPQEAPVPDTQPDRRLLLPPPFQAFAAGAGDILAMAADRATQGAGTILWREAGGVLAIALILEPGPPLATTPAEADLGYLAALAALCDTLAQHGQPERRVEIGWPDRVLYDGALLAGTRWQTGPAGPDGLPEWAVFAAEITASRDGLDHPGLFPNSTSLAEEEFPEAPPMIESLAAWLKLIVDRWSVHGPDAVLRRVLDRVPQPDALAGARIEGGRLKLPPLASVLDETRWRDPERGGPAW